MDQESRLELLKRLAEESCWFFCTPTHPEPNSWMVVHRHIHGVLPSEYDIREIDEALYLEVLNERKLLSAS
jgi:hypothetical protein